MKNTKKLLAVILSALMLLAVVPFAAGASGTELDAEAAAKIAGWKANSQLLLDNVFDNTQHVGWNYVLANDESIQKEYTAYTVFGLYDDAWRNGIDGSVDEAKAEAVLVSVLDAVDTGMSTEIEQKIIEILNGIDKAADAVEKVNDIANISDEIGGDTWNSVLGYVNTAAKVVNSWKNNKEKYIAAYAKLLSIKACSNYYLDYLDYVIANSPSDVLVAAAESIEDQYAQTMDDFKKDFAKDVIGDTGAAIAETAVTYAMNSNVYTAAALKIYGVAKNVVDKLWNCSRVADAINYLIPSFYAESAARDWAAAAFAGNDAKALFSVNTLLAFRENTLKGITALKNAQATGGIVNLVKSKLNVTITGDFVAEALTNEIIRGQLFGDEAAVPVKAIYSIFRTNTAACPITASVGDFTFGDEAAAPAAIDGGIVASAYNAQTKEYVKVAALVDGAALTVNANGTGKLTVVQDTAAGTDGKVVVKSINAVSINDGDVYVFDGTANYFCNDIALVLTNGYAYPATKPATASDVVEAGKEVIKDESKNWFASIMASFTSFFSKISEFFANLFKR